MNYVTLKSRHLSDTNSCSETFRGLLNTLYLRFFSCFLLSVANRRKEEKACLNQEIYLPSWIILLYYIKLAHIILNSQSPSKSSFWIEFYFFIFIAHMTQKKILTCIKNGILSTLISPSFHSLNFTKPSSSTSPFSHFILSIDLILLLTTRFSVTLEVPPISLFSVALQNSQYSPFTTSYCLVPVGGTILIFPTPSKPYSSHMSYGGKEQNIGVKKLTSKDFS